MYKSANTCFRNEGHHYKYFLVSILKIQSVFLDTLFTLTIFLQVQDKTESISTLENMNSNKKEKKHVSEFKHSLLQLMFYAKKISKS